MHREQSGEVESLRVFKGVLVGPRVIGLAEGAGTEGVLQPRISVYVRWDDHHLINALDVHIAQACLRLIRPGVIQICGLLLGEGGFGIEVADVERPLDVMRDSRPGHGSGPNAARSPAVRHAIDTKTRLAVDEQLLGFRFPPARRFERF